MLTLQTEGKSIEAVARVLVQPIQQFGMSTGVQPDNEQISRGKPHVMTETL